MQKFFRRKPQFAAENFRNQRFAETALAASHAWPAALFDAFQSTCAGGPVDRVEDFAFGNLLTAADNVAEGRVFADFFIVLGRGQIL